MSRRKRLIALSEPERLTLGEGSKYHPKHEFGTRCQALLLSGKGWSVQAIAQHLEVRSHTVGNWFTQWEQVGLMGLLRQPGQGRKPILSLTNSMHQQVLQEAVSTHYQDASRIQAELERALGQSMSRDTVKRFLKRIITPGIDSVELASPTKIQ